MSVNVLIVSVRNRMTKWMSPQTYIWSGMCDKNVTAPPGLCACCHLWEASWALANLPLSQTAVRSQSSFTLPTFMLCQGNFECKHLLHFRCSFPSCLFSPLFSSHFPPSSSPPVLRPMRLSVKLLTFVSKTRIASVYRLCTCDGSQCQRLVGSSGLLDLLFSPASRSVAALKWGHLLSDSASAFPTHTRTSHYATSSLRVQTKWNASCIRQMDSL